jgi:hypothetical protein
VKISQGVSHSGSHSDESWDLNTSMLILHRVEFKEIGCVYVQRMVRARAGASCINQKIGVRCIKQNSSTDVTMDDISYIYWETACLYLDIWCLTLMQLHMLW